MAEQLWLGGGGGGVGVCCYMLCVQSMPELADSNYKNGYVAHVMSSLCAFCLVKDDC